MVVRQMVDDGVLKNTAIFPSDRRSTRKEKERLTAGRSKISAADLSYLSLVHHRPSFRKEGGPIGPMVYFLWIAFLGDTKVATVDSGRIGFQSRLNSDGDVLEIFLSDSPTFFPRDD